MGQQRKSIIDNSIRASYYILSYYSITIFAFGPLVDAFLVPRVYSCYVLHFASHAVSLSPNISILLQLLNYNDISSPPTQRYRPTIWILSLLLALLLDERSAAGVSIL